MTVSDPHWLTRIVLALQRRIYDRIFRCVSSEASADFLGREMEAKLSLLAARSGEQARVEILLNTLRGALGHDEQFLAPSLPRRRTAPLNTWTFQNERMSFDISPGEKVLDIGSGGWPFKQATHLADMHPGNTSHRVEAIRRDHRPFIVIDAQHMPFQDNEWDFTFCSHVLEHLVHPGEACRELMRVSRKGYVEVPTRLSDVMLNFTRLKDHHRWHGLVLDQTLIFIEWPDVERREVGTNYFFQSLQSAYQNPFQKLFEDNWSMFYAMLPWRDRFNFLVIDKKGCIIDQEASSRTRSSC